MGPFLFILQSVFCDPLYQTLYRDRAGAPQTRIIILVAFFSVTSLYGLLCFLDED